MIKDTLQVRLDIYVLDTTGSVAIGPLQGSGTSRAAGAVQHQRARASRAGGQLRAAGVPGLHFSRSTSGAGPWGGWSEVQPAGGSAVWQRGGVGPAGPFRTDSALSLIVSYSPLAWGTPVGDGGGALHPRGSRSGDEGTGKRTPSITPPSSINRPDCKKRMF